MGWRDVAYSLWPSVFCHANVQRSCRQDTSQRIYKTTLFHYVRGIQSFDLSVSKWRNDGWRNEETHIYWPWRRRQPWRGIQPVATQTDASVSTVTSSQVRDTSYCWPAGRATQWKLNSNQHSGVYTVHCCAFKLLYILSCFVCA